MYRPDSVQMLRHTVATVAYRGGKVIRNAPDGFATFTAGPESRTPVQILAHIGDLFDWALSIVKGKEIWHDSAPQSWSAESHRFFMRLEAFDGYLASNEHKHSTPEALFQGPVADALWHIGQIAMLRRLAGSPIKGENYHRADIAAGQVGAEQTKPNREF
ncbi:MAG TPA: hypothetical protein VGI83_09040 [Gemmatimonadales bacterium]|jgi:hypothetical protein